MKKSLTFVFCAFLSLNIAIAQQQSIGIKNARQTRTTAANQKDINNISGSITSTSNYVAGITQVLTFDVTIVSPDAEYLDGLILTFPAGMTPIVAGTNDPMTPTNNTCTGNSGTLNPISGQVISWGEIATPTGCGWFAPGTFTLSVGVTAGAISGPQTIAFNAIGDGYGGVPHSFTGNITVNEASANDVGVLSVDVVTSLPGTIAPKATIQNFGSTAQTGFNVTMTINSTPPYSQTYNVATSLAAGATTQITFPNWTAALGTYSIKVKSLLVGDANTLNDSIVKSVSIISTMTTAYGFKVNTQPAKFILEAPELGFTDLGSATAWYSRGGAYVATAASEKWFVLGSDFNLYSVDTLTGVPTLIGATGGASGEYVSGLTYDKSTSTLYATKLSGTYPAFTFDLYTVDQTTGAMTSVATSPSTGTFFEIACNNAGDMFAIEHQQAGVGRFYSVDKATAALTLIGTDLGGNVSSNFQDIDFSENDVLYFTASMGTDGTLDGLYTINTSTGLPTLINLFPAANTQVVGLAIKKSYSPVSVNETTNNNNFTLFPNPSTDLVSVISKNNEIIETVRVLSISGQLVYNENVNHIATTLNLANFSNGFYFVEVKTSNGVYTQKIAVTK